MRALLLVALLLQGCGMEPPEWANERVTVGRGRPWRLPVPVVLDPSLSLEQRDYIKQAIEEWTRLAGVSFVGRTDEADFVRIKAVEEGACHSNVGMIGGAQEIAMAPGCRAKAARHELGHTLGLFHEQQRADRDEFVVVTTDFLEDQGNKGNFTKQPTYRPAAAYDYDSIMHYGSYDFGDGRRVIERIGGDPDIRPPGLITDLDADKVRAMYQSQQP